MLVEGARIARDHARMRFSRAQSALLITTLRCAAALAACLILLAGPLVAHAAPQLPELTGQVVDNAGLLTSDDRAAILRELQALEQASTDQVAVATVPSLDGYTIEDYAIALARKWQLGQKGKDNGILLLVAPAERKVRIEVGRRLEPIMTDTMSKIIIENAVLPKFRRGDYAGGIRDGVRDIKDVLLGDAEAVKERARGARTPQDDPTVFQHLAVWVAIILVILWLKSRSERQMADNMSPYDRKRSRRRRTFGPIVIVPGGSSDWGGGWSGGGGGSGGGWPGGGGSFGGGGASGGW